MLDNIYEHKEIGIVVDYAKVLEQADSKVWHDVRSRRKHLQATTWNWRQNSHFNRIR